MKFCGALILIFVTLASASPFSDYEDEKEAKQKRLMICEKEFNVTLLDVQDDIIYLYKLPEDNPKNQCLAKCVLEKIGLFDDNSGFKVEAIEKQLLEGAFGHYNNEVRAIIMNCAKIANEGTYANSCERSYRGVECMRNDVKEHDFKNDREARYRWECAVELKMPASELSNIKIRSPTFKCYKKCIYEKKGYFHKNSYNIDVEYVYDYLYGGSKKDPSGKILARIEECAKFTEYPGHTECERALEAVDCVTFY